MLGEHVVELGAGYERVRCCDGALTLVTHVSSRRGISGGEESEQEMGRRGFGTSWRRIRLEEHRLSLLRESRQEGGDAEGPLLLHAREAVGLGLDAGLVDEDACVGSEAGKGKDAALVDRHNLARAASAQC